MAGKQIEFFSQRKAFAGNVAPGNESFSNEQEYRETGHLQNYFQTQLAYEQTGRTSRFSRDEMNLAEFPLSVLSTRVNPNKKTLEFEDSVIDKNGNQVNRQWIITAADKFGLPTASDDEILLGLLKISVDKGLDKRKVYFTRYELLRTLNWTTEGRSYKRLTNALDRLSGVRIKATNSFYDNESKAFSTRNFGIIDEYEINSGKTANAKPSFFVWSEVLHKSFSSGFIKKLDFDFFLQLESAVSKRLYRFLDKHFWYRAKFTINLFTLAHEKIGVSRTYQFPSSLRQQLDPAIVELVDLGFLSHVEYTGKGKATVVTFYAAGENGRRSQRGERALHAKKSDFARKNAPSLRDSSLLGNQSPPNKSLGWNTSTEMALRSEGSDQENFEREPGESRPEVSGGMGLVNHIEGLEQALVQRGVHPVQVRRICEMLRERDAVERAHSIIKYFDSLVGQQSPLVSRNPAGFLFRALQKPFDFVLPEDKAGGAVVQRGGAQGNGVRRNVGGRGVPRQSLLGNANSLGSSAVKTPELDESLYLTERKREIARLLGDVEPALLKQFQNEVQLALENIRDLVSESGFREAVKHGVEEKVAKLFAIPDFDEWKRRRR